MQQNARQQNLEWIVHVHAKAYFHVHKYKKNRTHLAQQVADGAGDGLGEALNHDVGEVVHVRTPLGNALGHLLSTLVD